MTNLAAMQSELNQNFSAYVRGKHVVIVCCGEGVNDGQYIDSFDCIVRIHEPLPSPGARYVGGLLPPRLRRWTWPSFVPEEWHTHIGRRTTIFYHRYRADTRQQFERDREDLCAQVNAFHSDGGQFYCAAQHEDVGSLGSILFSHDIKPVRSVSNEHIVRLWHLLGNRPQVETICVSDILRYDPASIYIASPSFTQDSDIKWLKSLTQLRIERT